MNSYIPTAYPNPGETVGKYVVERMLGEGGMGAVARGKHKITLAPAALKFMSPAFLKIEGAVQRFLNESRAAGRIRSEHVVTIYDVGELPNGAPYIAMEYLEGKDLQQLIENEGLGGLPIERAVFLVTQILAGLQAAHGNGVIHRDMKPSNCFIIKRSGEEFVKLLDFGISKIVEPGKKNLTQTNSALGTPLYMAPEQASSPKDVDQRSDLYAVGTLLYEMLTGATPFTSETGELAEILYKIFTADVPNLRIRRADAPEGLAAVVQKVLSRSPGDRYATALEFAEALAPYGDHRVDRLHRSDRDGGVSSGAGAIGNDSHRRAACQRRAKPQRHAGAARGAFFVLRRHSEIRQSTGQLHGPVRELEGARRAGLQEHDADRHRELGFTGRGTRACRPRTAAHSGRLRSSRCCGGRDRWGVCIEARSERRRASRFRDNFGADGPDCADASKYGFCERDCRRGDHRRPCRGPRRC